MIDWCRSLFRPRGQPLPEKSGPDPAASRAAMTISCHDTAAIPKGANAGMIISHNGRDVQVMHEGTLVRAGGYEGEWMAGIIRELRGHHEPQEELLFHHVVQHCRPGTTIMEVGAFWAYYTNWYLGAVAKSKAICVEPDVANMACGQENLALNGRAAIWVHAAVGCKPVAPVAEAVPHHSLDGLFQVVGRCPIEMLHIDAQGAELSFLESCASAAAEGLLRFAFVSTHHESISGSATTHADCLRHLLNLGAVILAEFGVDESFSGDGLIVASFCAEDAQIHLPSVSRNTPAHSLFGRPAAVTGQVSLAGTDLGPMLVYDGDQTIGGLLREKGTFEERSVTEVVRFLRQRYDFQPRLFVDVGASIGTHLIHALRHGMFLDGVGIEMDEKNFRLLTCNVMLNLRSQPQLFNRALSDRSGAILMERSPDNFGDHRIVAPGAEVRSLYNESDRAVMEVPATTLDLLASEAGLRIDDTALVWIDTQGHEGHVLAGAGGILAASKPPCVVCEFWPYGLERAGGRELFFEFLEHASGIHNITAAGWETAEPLTAADLHEMFDRLLGESSRDRYPHIELLCVL